MNLPDKLIASLASLALIAALLITSVEIAAYGDYGYYEREYQKYGVPENIGMETDDLMYVTREMMAYLRGGREELSVETTVNGQTRDFFNEQDRFHMGEVRELFLGGLTVRRVSLLIAVLSVIVLAVRKAHLSDLLARTFLAVTGAAAVITLAVGIFAAVDFDRAFAVFHLIFFDNDLWMFDASTDLMINMLVEGFFMDIALRIALIFAALLAAVCAVCLAEVFLPGRKSRGKKTGAALMAAVLLGGGILPAAVPMSARADGLTSPVETLVTEHVEHDFTFPREWPEAPEINAGAAVLLEAETGTVLYAKNADVELYPASITKVMTGLLTAEYGRMSDTVLYSYDAIYTNLELGAMTMGISMGEEISVKDSFYGMMLQSANDAANGLAEYVAGSNESFAALMNTRAAQIGAYNTHFDNPSGLFGATHYTTCYDMALIMAEAVKNPTYLTVSTTRYYEIEPTNKYPQIRYLYLQHQMKPNSAYAYDGFVCGKTGFIDESGNTLVTYCERNGMKLIAVVMRATNPGHYQDTTALMDYGFDHFQLVQVDGFLTGESGGNDYLNSTTDLFGQAGFAIEENHDSQVVIPKDASADDVECTLNYDLDDAERQENVIAEIVYSYKGMQVGSGTLEFVRRDVPLSVPHDAEETDGNGEIPPDTESGNKKKEIVLTVSQVMAFVGAVLAVIAVIVFLVIYLNPRRVRLRRIKRRRRQRERRLRRMRRSRF